MLSTNSTSSIQKRRQQQHRRQQSLAVPILATPLPAYPRRTQPARNAHRRGLSLDQSLSQLDSAAPLHPIHLQDQRHFQDQDQDDSQDHQPGSSPVRLHPGHTNTGPTMDSQHYQQETQQQSLAQPGFQIQDFQSHLQQQMSGRMQAQRHVMAPTPISANQQAALRQLQHHVEWYNKNFGSASPEPRLPFDLRSASNSALNGLNTGNGATQSPQRQIDELAMTHAHPQTVPNTPQHYAQSWPSPPVTHAKHARSQSFQLDVAPMPTASRIANNSHPLQIASSPGPFVRPVGSFAQDSFTLGNDNNYAPSSYTPSVVEATSPAQNNNQASGLPTLFEEAMSTPPFMQQGPSAAEDSILLQAIASASGTSDFDNADFGLGGSSANQGLSPKATMLDGLGPAVNATILDTGIPLDDIDEHISEQHPITKLFYCLYVDKDGTRCDKWHKRKENARSHVQGHLGDRQFLCNDCGKTFVRQHDMKRHAAIHNPDRPHRCPCGSCFARHDALTRHRQRGMCSGTLPGFERSEEDKPKRGRPKKNRPDQVARTDKAQRARRMDRENDLAAAITAAYASSSASCGGSERSLPMTPPDTSDDINTNVYLDFANEHSSNTTVPLNKPSTSLWNDTPPTSPIVGSATGLADKIEMYGLPNPQQQQQQHQQPNSLPQLSGISPAMLTQRNAAESEALLLNTTNTIRTQVKDTMPHAHPSPAPSIATFDGGSSPSAQYSQHNETDFNFGAINAQPDVATAGGTSPVPAFFSDAFSPSDSSGSECEFLTESQNILFGEQLEQAVKNSSFYANEDDLFGDHARDEDISLLDALDQFISTH